MREWRIVRVTAIEEWLMIILAVVVIADIIRG